MSITVKRTLDLYTTYGDTGITISQGNREVEFKYTIASIENFDGSTCTGIYRVEVEGQLTAELYRLTFAYSGDGSPLTQAEQELETYFATQSILQAAAVKASEAAENVEPA